ncbi:hypothetical protein ACIBEJ_18190 [Nonomuraea sp. NPDC050790]|uniref:hypothetical protein n=1 Tax=Nonomuraea sp. NPDC050790 TaxID=3364371 RepID=UPI0037B23EED
MSTNDSERDWFAPPAGQPAQPQRPQQPRQPAQPQQPQQRRRQQQQSAPPVQRPRRAAAPTPQPRPRQAIHADQQVWPPAAAEPTGSSTQPIPAIPSAGPLPPRPPQPPWTPPEETPPATPPRRPRRLLLGVAAVAALIAAFGAPTVDRYLFYKSGRPSPTVHLVEPGQTLTYEHVSWKSAIEPTKAPPGSRHNTPDKQWLKITVIRSATDETGAVLTAKPELSLKDAGGRMWKAEIYEDDLPADKHEVGKEYSYLALAVVPATVGEEVQLNLEPNITYRSDTPTKKLMDVSEEDMEKSRRNDVIVFRR